MQLTVKNDSEDEISLEYVTPEIHKSKITLHYIILYIIYYKKTPTSPLR